MRINKLVQGCKRLKYQFHGVFAADNFLLHLSENSFIIMNVSTSQSIGTHWILIGQRNEKFIFADPLGQNLTSYKHLHNRFASPDDNIQTVYELLRNQPIQKQNLILCGLFCIYIAHYLFDKKEIVEMSDVDSIRFALHMML